MIEDPKEIILKLFKSMVVSSNQVVSEHNLDLVDYGLVLNFKPTMLQTDTLKRVFQPIEVSTLFTVEERRTTPLIMLLTKQVLHYIEVYGLGKPGLFKLEAKGGQVVNMNHITGISKTALGVMVRKLIYANAPLEDAVGIARVIEYYEIKYDIGKIKNNESKIMLWQPGVIFSSGDDAVRYICYAATKSPMLIKSPEVIEAVKGKAQVRAIPLEFLHDHEVVLAQVFNRHKRIILSLKRGGSAYVNAVNRISKRSKREHKPIVTAINKVWINQALYNPNNKKVLSHLDSGKITIRDKFKYLNLLNFYYEQTTGRVYTVRNGKLWLRDRASGVWAKDHIRGTTEHILKSLKKDLKHLKTAKILLDNQVSYGLPISRKQALGNLPFGSSISLGRGIAAGIHWRNAWGASDLDLSGVKDTGKRVGWGEIAGYNDEDLEFSGDVTNAENGAMEFITTGKRVVKAGLFVNVYSGNVPCKMEIVVGKPSDEKWIEDCVLREKVELKSKGVVAGIMKDGKFVVWQGRIGTARHNINANSGDFMARGFAEWWTITELFNYLGIDYDTGKQPRRKYDYDLSYAGFTYDKLEDMLINSKESK